MAEKELGVPKTLSLLAICKEFSSTTSMHGVGRALSNKHPFRRFLWAVLVVMGFGVAVYQFVGTINDFYTFPVTTVVTVNQETKEMFPGITICNLNRKRRSKIHPKLLDFLSNVTETDEAPIDTVINVILRKATLTQDDHSGHQLEDMLTKCVFNRNRCREESFTPLYTATYGTCHTFRTDPFTKSATRPGPQSGLILELNIEQYEYLPITSKAGVKVIVHPHDETPFPEDGGILALPGAVTSIGVRKVITHRLPTPYSNCSGPTGEGSSQRILFGKYTQTTCLKSCYQTTLYKECGCCDVDVPCQYENKYTVNGTKGKLNHIVAYCNNNDSLTCEYTIEDQFLRGDLDCDERCPPPCDSTTFNTVVSTALWPSDSYFDTFVKQINATILENRNFTSTNSLQRFVSSNFLRIEIFLESLDVVDLAAVPKYDWNMLLGTLGGQLGLWLGFSLLTALELAELLMDAVCFCIRIRYKKITITKKEKKVTITEKGKSVNITEKVKE